MSTIKTKQHEGDVMGYIDSLTDAEQQADCKKLIAMMEALTGETAMMWGKTLIGFGSYDYKQSNGKPGKWFLTGFGPRKGQLSIYIMTGFDKYPELMEKLGPHKTGVGCLYIKKLQDVNADVLSEIIGASYNTMKAKHVS